MTDYLHFTFDEKNLPLLSVMDELPLWSAPFGAKILDAIPYAGGLQVLDIGSGLGFPLLEIAMRMGRTTHVYGIDPWETGLQRIRRKMEAVGVDNLVACQGRAEWLPFRDASFDLLVSNNGINNVQDIRKTLEECARVARPGAPFLLTMNTEESFLEFYEVYRAVLDELNLGEYRKGIREHIYQKRKPVAAMVEVLETTGFQVERCREELFHLRFADGSAMLNHFFIKLAFLGPWKQLLPEELQEKVFAGIEERLNLLAASSGLLSLRVPFVVLHCRRSLSA